MDLEQITKAAKDAAEGMKSDIQGQIKGLEEQIGKIKGYDPQAPELVKMDSAIQKLQSTLDSVESRLEQFKSAENHQVSMKGQVVEFIQKNFDKIKEIKSAGNGHIEFSVKVVDTIAVANGTNTSPPAVTGVQQAPLSNINFREAAILGAVSGFSTSLAAYPYTEAKPKDGDYEFVLEKGTKPQVDLSWETNYAQPKKIAAWIKLSDESVTDVVGLQSVATDMLFKKHQLKKMRAILFGTGTGAEPKGATVYGRVFSAGALALGVTNPNFMDVVNAGITDIATTHNFEDEMPYMANIVLVNPNDFYLNLVAAKDNQGLPLYPSASLFNQVNIGGVTIIPEETITAGKIFICDMSKYFVSSYVPYTVKIGWVNDDFIKNQFVILGESRFHAFVKKLDEQAFLYDDIATIKTAITAVSV
jgi:archaellum component FlaC